LEGEVRNEGRKIKMKAKTLVWKTQEDFLKILYREDEIDRERYLTDATVTQRQTMTLLSCA
jgi:hypothetical protein